MLFVCLLVALLGCDSTFDASRLDNNLENTEWLFERAEATNGDVRHDSTTSRRASITFGERSPNSTTYDVNGYNGCNAFSGRYSVDGAELQFIQIAQTERACMEVEARIEEVFNRGILGARNFSIVNDELVIDAPTASVKLRLVRATDG